MRIVIAAGGTGGHLYPAIAYAKAFQRMSPGLQVVFVGSGKSLEGEILQKEGFVFERIRVEGVIGRKPTAMLRALALLPQSIWQSLKILHAHPTDLVIGTGGYFSPPVILAAWLLRIPRVLLEPNAMPGFANRVLCPLADRVFVAFASAARYLGSRKSLVIGTPVRQEFVAPPPPPLSRSVSHLLVFGGSQGAQALNTAMVEAVAISSLMRGHLTITHQTGPDDDRRVRSEYERLGISADVQPFLFDMPKELRRADLVVCRAGASTLAELAAFGKVGILVPFPHATHQHQAKNAQAVQSQGAAVIISQAELTGQRLAETIERFMQDPMLLRTMGERSWALRQVQATEQMVQECLALVGGRAGGMRYS
jgi:UDP-N-acetylglucosamine--N-acetylmuramyl-(pentapeptide) pyrophosphoryl-undecaprenol N-acetylglucosamine transferase